MSSITLLASCHCGNFSVAYTIPSTAFPLKSSICHCNICRHTSGHLFGTFAVIPSDSRPDVSSLTEYKSSSWLNRYFCPRCGASVCTFEEGEWDFATGVLEVQKGESGTEGLQGLLNRVQLWVDDSRDGGGAMWIDEIASRPHERHKTHRQSELVSEEDLAALVKKSRSDEDELAGSVTECRCHCGSVAFTIIPSSSGNGKYPAGLDACTSCRKVSGSEITAWVTVPQTSMSKANAPVDLSSRIFGTYQTSTDVTRYFCRICGATIFYLKDGKDTIDFGAGLLRANSGARAENWLEWEKYGNKCVAYQEDAIDREFVAALVRGINADKREPS